MFSNELNRILREYNAPSAPADARVVLTQPIKSQKNRSMKLRDDIATLHLHKPVRSRKFDRHVCHVCCMHLQSIS